jgi:histidine phosphotransfer protein HptB
MLLRRYLLLSATGHLWAWVYMRRVATGQNMIDWTRLSELRQEIGEDDLQEVVEMFLDETDEVIRKLGASPKGLSLESELHFLKGSALNLGFSELAELCQDGERKAANGDDALVNVVRIIDLYHLSKTAFLDAGAISSAA